MIGWRRHIAGAAAALLTLPLTTAGAEIDVRIVDGDVVVTGLTPADLAAPEKVLRVTVGPDAPSIVGDYTIEGSVLRFRPMFPLDPGRRYVVRLDVAGGPVETHVSLPAREVASTTVVRAIYPTADVLPENQLKLYVHFSAPMAGGDGLPFIRLLDEDGEEVIDPFLPLGDAFWDRERRRYTVFFDPGRVKRGILPHEEMGRPLLQGKSYTLAIDASWPDAEGAPLATAFYKEFFAGPPDEVPVDPSTWEIHAPSSGTREPLVVDFPEPLDHAVLSRALTVENVDGEVEIPRGETEWSFVPAYPWKAGDYTLVALTLLEDLAGNRIGKPFEVDVFERIDAAREDSEADAQRILFVIRD